MTTGPQTLTVAIIGAPTVIYTMIGGVQAVTWVDVKQMALIVFALIAVFIVLLVQLPVSPGDALDVAGATGHPKPALAANTAPGVCSVMPPPA